jgi:hypothetical protein
MFGVNVMVKIVSAALSAIAVLLSGSFVRADSPTAVSVGYVAIDVVDDGDRPKSIPGVTILVNGKDAGISPVSAHQIAIPSGKSSTVTITAKLKDYSTATKEIEVIADELVKIAFKLKPSTEEISEIKPFIVEQDFGTVIVVVAGDMGPDTMVYIDGDDKGLGSLKISKLAVGKRGLAVQNLRLLKRFEKEIDLEKGQTQIFSADSIDGLKLLKKVNPR